MFSDLQNYNRATFFGDLSAGLVTGIVTIPLSLGLAIATGVPPVWGLYTSVVAGILAALFGGSRFSVSGPAAAMIPILAPIITVYGLAKLPAIGLLAGVLLVIFGLLKLGDLIRYVPPAVTYGFTAGIAVVIATGQLNNFFGLTGVPGSEYFHQKLLGTLTHLPQTNVPALLLGLLALLILLALPRVPGWLGRIPASLVAVVACTALPVFVPYFAGVTTIAEAFGVLTLGPPPLRWPLDFGDWPTLLLPALKIAFLISIESLLCAVVADKMTRTRHAPNRELVAQGLANLATPFFTGIPATAVIARTGTSIKNGARTRLAAAIHALVVLLFLVALAPLGSQIPLTVLAAILFVTAWKISEAKEIAHLWRLAPRADLLVLILTFFLTVLLDLTVSVGFGLVLSALLIFRRLSAARAEEVTARNSFVNETIRQALEKYPDVQFVNLEGNLTMGFGHTLLEIVPLHRKTRRLILRLRDVQQVDLSGLTALAELLEHAKKHGAKIYLTGIGQSLLPDFTRFGLPKKADGVYTTTTDAVRALFPGGERRQQREAVTHERRSKK